MALLVPTGTLPAPATDTHVELHKSSPPATWKLSITPDTAATPACVPTMVTVAICTSAPDTPLGSEPMIRTEVGGELSVHAKLPTKSAPTEQERAEREEGNWRRNWKASMALPTARTRTGIVNCCPTLAAANCAPVAWPRSESPSCPVLRLQNTSSVALTGVKPLHDLDETVKRTLVKAFALSVTTPWELTEAAAELDEPKETRSEGERKFREEMEGKEEPSLKEAATARGNCDPTTPNRVSIGVTERAVTEAGVWDMERVIAALLRVDRVAVSWADPAVRPVSWEEETERVVGLEETKLETEVTSNEDPSERTRVALAEAR